MENKENCHIKKVEYFIEQPEVDKYFFYNDQSPKYLNEIMLRTKKMFEVQKLNLI